MPAVNGAWAANAVDPTHAPDATFPGATAAISNAAFPTIMSDTQPAVLSGWPMTAVVPATATTAVVPATAAGCWYTTVVQDHANGWPGQCDGLTEQVNQAVNGTVAAVTQQECSDACVRDAACTTWVFKTDSAVVPTATHCWIGAGNHCFQANTVATTVVTAAQRIQRGNVRVLKDMQGYQVLNLANLGVFQAAESSADGAQRCQNWCYSSIYCNYWSYAADGCSVETQANAAAYPLTTAGVAQNNAYTTGQVAGEYIQHYCPPVTTTVAPAVPAPAPSAPAAAGAAPVAPALVCASTGWGSSVYLWIFGCTPWWVIALLALLALLLIGLCCHFCTKSESKKPKSTRAVKQKAQKETAKAPVVAPQEMQPLVESPSQQPLLQPQYMQQPQYTYAQPQYQRPVPQYAQQSFAIQAPQYQYAQAQQADPLLQSRVAVPDTPASVSPSLLPPGAEQYKVGDRVAVWSRNNNTWHDDAQVSAVDQQGWHVRYNNNQTQKVVLFSDAQNLRPV